MESNEILAVVDSVSTEKGLEKDVIFKAIEEGLSDEIPTEQSVGAEGGT